MSNAAIAAALDNLSKTIAANPDKARAKHAPATATIVDGLRCQVTGPAGESIETDMPAPMGGAAASPNPGWYFRAAMAACCSTVIAQRAARLGIELTRLEVTVAGDGDNRGILGLDETVSAGHSAISHRRADQRAQCERGSTAPAGAMGERARARSAGRCTMRRRTRCMST